MPNYDLGIKHSYVPHWGLWEGLRELVQNYLDGRDDYSGSGKGSIRHTGSELVLTNKDTELDRSAWLLGQTSKAQRSDQRGQWGDGLKTGALALVRAGHDVIIDNASERWRPNISPSEQFGGVETLHVNIRKLRVPRNDFQVRVKVSREDWNRMKDRFLDLCSNVTKLDAGHHGQALTDPEMIGRIYAKGIFVANDPNLDCGYNFYDLSLDRDRGTVSSWSLNSEVAWIERTLLENGTRDAADMYARLASGNSTLDRVADLLEYSDDKGRIAAGLVECFTEEWGAKARPCENEGEATKMSYFGLRGIVVPKTLRDTLKIQFGDFNKMLRDAINDSGNAIDPADLSDRDRTVYNRALNILALSDNSMDLDRLRRQVKVFQFDAAIEDAPLGLYMTDRIAPGVAEIRINTSELASLAKFLGTLIHEVAHDYGQDGTLAHRSAEERIWENVTGVLLEFLGEDFID